MTFTEAAAQVLRLVGKPLHYKEITDVAIERNLLSHVGKSPEVTMGARLAALVKKNEKDNPLVRIKPGVFALRDWDDKMIEDGLADRTPALQRIMERGGDVEVSEAESPESPSRGEEARKPLAAHRDLGSVPPPRDEDELRRAELSAGATQLFEQEEDDDQPIFGGPEAEPDEKTEGGESAREGRRRRRRRRGRGKRDEEVTVSGGGGGDEEDLPGYTVSDAPMDGEQGEAEGGERRAERGERDRGERAERGERDRDRGERDRDRDRGERGERGERDRDRGERERDRGERDRDRDRGERDRDRGERQQPLAALEADDVEGSEGETGRTLADTIARVVGGFDRSRGPVALQNVADALRRRVRGGNELGLNAGSVTAVVAADNLRAEREGRAPRFRLAGGRLALSEWSRDKRVDAQQKQVERELSKLSELTRRALLDALKALPHRGLGELLVVLLEQVGIENIGVVRRPGTHGAELHLSGMQRTAAGSVPLAIVVRRDGKDVGRERVTELRGALHHYGPAAQGWIITTGQVLSGAREEAAVLGAAPVALSDGLELARLCEQHGVGVTTTRIELPAIDLALLDSLRG